MGSEQILVFLYISGKTLFDPEILSGFLQQNNVKRILEESQETSIFLKLRREYFKRKEKDFERKFKVKIIMTGLSRKIRI